MIKKIIELIFGLNEYQTKIAELDALLVKAKAIRAEYIGVKDFDMGDSALWLKLSDIYETEEFCFFMEHLEKKFTEELCSNNQNLEQKAMFLAGIRQVSNELAGAKEIYNSLSRKSILNEAA